MRTFSETFDAGETIRLSVSGSRYFRLLTTSYPVSIDFRRDNRALGQQSTDVESGYYAIPGGGFDEISITSATAQTVKFAIATGEGGYDRISGEVSVISGEVSRSEAGLAFMGGAAQAAVAAQYSHVQIWNPAANTKNLIVNEVLVAADSPGVIALRGSAVALTTLDGNPSSKKIGAAASTSEIRRQTNAAILGTGQGFSQTPVLVNTAFRIPLVEPFIVAPGFGLLAYHETVNSTLRASFQFYEKPL